MAGQVIAGVNPKSVLRKQVVAARDALAPDTRRELSTRVTSRLLELDAYRNARCLLAYMSFGSEFDTAGLITDALANGKTLCLPRVVPDQRLLQVHCVENLERDLQSGTWGIREPRSDCPVVNLDQIDFVLLPGVAFTLAGDRLGYGGGFYDRLIPRFATRPPLAAAAFGVQIRDEIPIDDHDQRVDLVVTEDSTFRQRD